MKEAKKYANLFAGVVVAILLAMPGYAQASIIIDGGTLGAIPDGASNDTFHLFGLLPSDDELTGFYGAQINVPVATNVTIEVFGAEAGFNNSFFFNNTKLYTHPGRTIVSGNLGSPLASFSVYASAAGSLNFSFGINSISEDVLNGFNPDNSSGTAGPNFFASRAGAGDDVVYLFLDDGGAGSDKDYDDLLIRITEIPEPQTITLFVFGLAMVGLVMRLVSATH